MKTLCNEYEESVYLFPDFIPIRFDEDMGQWWIKDYMTHYLAPMTLAIVSTDPLGDPWKVIIVCAYNAQGV